MTQLYKNNAYSTLSGNVAIGATSLSVQTGHGDRFPQVTAPDIAFITLEDSGGNREIIKVTARAGGADTMTIVRAQEGTAARAWTSGDVVEQRITAAELTRFESLSMVEDATSKAVPVDADLIPLKDSAASNGLKYLTWANLKATLKTYLDTLYQSLTGDVTLAAGKTVIFEGTTDDAFETTLTAGEPTADRVVTLPDATDTLVGMATASTLTNKRITARVGSTTSHATPTINTDNVDIYKLTAQAEAITSMTTNLSGTPTDGQVLIIQITGTAARAITWGASFEASTVALPTTTVTTAMLSVGFLWNSVTSKWRCMASV